MIHFNFVFSVSSKVFCLTFENGYEAEGGTYVKAINVERVTGGIVSGYAAKFNGVNSRIEIPHFTNNQIATFTFSLWYKRTGTSAGMESATFEILIFKSHTRVATIA